MPAPAGLVAEALGDHRLSDPDRAVDDYRLAGLDEPERGEVTYLGGGGGSRPAEVATAPGELVEKVAAPDLHVCR